ncbi:AraC family transcriptional regulator [Paenibacillus sambharensis]|uniref:AraC family transcriptional regulator n=2 Tax=Paenibacillus sambharensis TaxID=1803190 RepID=A0A2W1LMS7_9BACL|nr:AraC family transcriptional regulator [Paenibacillus sambharensis]
MKPMRKQFDLQTPFPFEYNYRDPKHPLTELPDHLHEWYELVYIYTGSGSFFVDRTLYDMRQGDLFLLPSNTIHRSLPDPHDRIISTAIFFSGALVQQPALGEAFTYLRCFEHARKRQSYRLRLQSDDQRQLEQWIDAIHSEHKQQLTGYRQAVLLLLQQILLFINRQVAPAGSELSTEHVIRPLWMRSMLQYIDENPSGQLGLNELARRAAVTPAHFSRVFKQLTGMNVTEYVTAKRVILAKELLIATDDNVSQIAERCGFESLPHFHRMFKKVSGMTPSAYKRSHLAPLPQPPAL